MRLEELKSTQETGATGTLIYRSLRFVDLNYPFGCHCFQGNSPNDFCRRIREGTGKPHLGWDVVVLMEDHGRAVWEREKSRMNRRSWRKSPDRPTPQIAIFVSRSVSSQLLQSL